MPHKGKQLLKTNFTFCRWVAGAIGPSPSAADEDDWNVTIC